MKLEKRRPVPVRAAARTLSILDTFADVNSPRGLTLTDVSRRVGMSSSTVYRLLAELELAGFVQRHPVTDGYVLGPAVIQLGRAAVNQIGFGDAAHAVMAELQAKIKEGVTLAVRRGIHAVYIHQVASSHILRTDLKVGSAVPLHCTAVGKVLLAFCSSVEFEEIVTRAGLEVFTQNTITDLEALRREVALVRQRGYSVDNEEFLPGVRCMGVPVRDVAGEVIAAMAVTGPVQRMPDETLDRIRPLLVSASEQMSRLLVGLV